MKFQGALIEEQGVKFAIVIVEKRHLDSNRRREADGIIQSFQVSVFPGIPVVLMAQDHRGTPTYYGREDIAKFMANVPLENVPWEEYTVR